MKKNKLSQNFLIDKNVAHKIIREAKLEKQDNVLEIGSGIGILTKIIQPLVKHLIVVEIDKKLCERLSKYFLLHNINNVEVINYDFMKFNFKVNNILKNNAFKIISNLPYSIGTAIIRKILPIENWNIAIFMLQKEVAYKLVAEPGNEKYGYISILILYYTNTKVLFNVKPTCFQPIPKVTSSVIRLMNKHSKYMDPFFFEIIKHFFNTRRKTILNCLSTFKNLGKIRATKIIKECYLNLFLRPNNLTMQDYINITKKIKFMGKFK
ncbi:MAG: 16S rRNA (adenine(1518)-N(6)/adenine(1519)-N(6))-dimethyltransferase RsmA [Endomicrobium sp.]|jgi:16S rRNA (adenine1518-N6/adenine1519-N6)-dimethyltransferase|nr:16S rRNA (adenine(1518)-N(6)/adenine(1519)-N(6))-dimethyltransferase RsmA [Endomicrobium sp.]